MIYKLKEEHTTAIIDDSLISVIVEVEPDYVELCKMNGVSREVYEQLVRKLIRVKYDENEVEKVFRESLRKPNELKKFDDYVEKIKTALKTALKIV